MNGRGGAVRAPGLAAVVAVFVGGCIGTGLRYGVVEIVGPTDGWPWATMTVNLLGSYLLGLLVRGIRNDAFPPVIGQFAGTGVMGSLTTFSALAVESLQLAEARGLASAMLYAGVTVTLGVGVAAKGIGR